MSHSENDKLIDDFMDREEATNSYWKNKVKSKKCLLALDLERMRKLYDECGKGDKK